MVRLINTWTNTEMYVAEDRLEEYLNAGHIRPTDEALKDEKTATKSKKTTTKKTVNTYWDKYGRSPDKKKIVKQSN